LFKQHGFCLFCSPHGNDKLPNLTPQPTAPLRHGLDVAVSYAKLFGRSQNAVISVYDAAGNVIARHEHGGDFKEP
jgi:hypothetical protein